MYLLGNCVFLLLKIVHHFYCRFIGVAHCILDFFFSSFHVKDTNTLFIILIQACVFTYHLTLIDKTVDGIFCNTKDLVTFGVKHLSSNLFKVSIFSHRNLDNAMSALDYKDMSQLLQRKLSQKVSCTYLDFIRSSFFTL